MEEVSIALYSCTTFVGNTGMDTHSSIPVLCMSVAMTWLVITQMYNCHRCDCISCTGKPVQSGLLNILIFCIFVTVFLFIYMYSASCLK